MSDHEKIEAHIAEQKSAFESFKKANDEALAEAKAFGKTTAETAEKVDRIGGHIDELKSQMNSIEAAAKRGAGMVSEEESKANEQAEFEAKAFDRLLHVGDDRLKDEERKALTVNSDSDGGFTVHADMSGRIAKRVFETSPMRQIASVQAINTDALEGPTDIDQAGFAWETEEQAPTNSDTPKLGRWRIPTHEWRAIPEISQKLLEDSSVDIQSWLVDKVGDVAGRGTNTAFVSGTGVGQPKGILSYADGTDWGQIEQIASGASGAIDSDAIINLIYATKADYRANANFVMSRETQGAVRKLKDGDGNYLWQPSFQAGQPDRLAGYGVVEFNDMPNVAANALSMGFGDFRRGYQIVDRVSMSVLVDPYSNKPFVQYYTRGRVGGAVINFEAIKLMKIDA